MPDLSARSIIQELYKSGPGRAGLFMIVTLIVVSMAVVIFYPRDFGSARWSNPSLWADNPKSSPPVWANAFTRNDRPRHLAVTATTPDSVEVSSRATEEIYLFEYSLDAASAPTFVSVSITDVVYSRRPPVITWTLFGPDDREIDLTRIIVSGPRRGESAPYSRYSEDPQRTVVGTDERVIDELILHFREAGYGTVGPRLIAENLEEAVFGVPNGSDGFDLLRGDYRFEAVVLKNSGDDSIGSLRLVVGGGAYGVMGTDALGRDLAAGLLFGLPVALLIGIATSTVSTILGMTLGMISGYTGGWVDLTIQRAADIVANIPVLPLLIFLVFIGGSQLWLILMVLVAFSWPGLTIMVRTMVLQLRTGQEVEATRALGASDGRIIVRHILPHAASYVLAQLVFFAPSAILAEAGLSFLGLGDPRIPTWGQILEYGFRTGAVFLGYWWWVVPPGLLIVITAMTFMFLALGLEPVVDPRLRGRRSWHF